MKLKLSALSVRFKIIFAQSAIMAGILILSTFVLSELLDQIINKNLDKFLHQQSDNFQATISIQNNKISFHDLNSNFDHRGAEKDEIPFYVQFLDLHGQTLMLSGNLEGRRLYHGEVLPDTEIFETVSFFEKPSRRLIAPVLKTGHTIGWVIVTVPYEFLEEFKLYKTRILFVIMIAGVIFFIFLSMFFVKLALKPVQELAMSAQILADQSEISSLPSIESNDEFGYLTKTLNNLLYKAGQSMETLELFAANVSHELKTPLALMHSEISILKRDIESPHQFSFDLLAQEVDRMQTLIDNLLVISNSQQPYELLLSDIWLQDFISDEAGRIQRIFRSKNMHFDFSKVGSTKVSSDIYLLQLVLDNVLRNAILYSPDNSTISISTTHDETEISIIVIDAGPGIPKEEMSKLYDPFVRGELSTNHSIKGSGLGLSISNWAINLLKGSLDLENHTPRGLKASIKFPAR